MAEIAHVAPVAVRFTVNGEAAEVSTLPNRTLLEVVREDLGLTGSKEGCGTGDCGACTMIVDGKTVTSCLVLAPIAEGKDIRTIEGVANGGTLHPVQQAFVECGGTQCGFCTPGFIMSAVHLLENNPNPTEHEIRVGISGNICRCTGYNKIVDAIALAAERLR